MTEVPIYWPRRILPPQTQNLTQNAFSRAGNRSLGGLNRSVVSDLGFWSIAFNDVWLGSQAARRTFNAIRTSLRGRAGLVSVPVRGFDTAPYVSGAVEAPIASVHSDGSAFSDGSKYLQGAITVLTVAAASIGDTSITLQAVNAAPNLSGILFSYHGALYQTGPASNIAGDNWTLPIFPAIRAAIPAGSTLDCDQPRCLCRLATDSEMDGPLNNSQIDSQTVKFLEAIDYWSDLALT